MHRVIAKDPRNAERIFPYIGGEEVNDSPTHSHHRYVINFGEMSEEEARSWPDLMKIVEERVKPERDQLREHSSARPRKEKWWLYGRYRPGLFDAIRGLERVLVHAFVSKYVQFAFVPSNYLVGCPNQVFAYEMLSPFCVLQSRST